MSRNIANNDLSKKVFDAFDYVTSMNRWVRLEHGFWFGVGLKTDESNFNKGWGSRFKITAMMKRLYTVFFTPTRFALVSHNVPN